MSFLPLILVPATVLLHIRAVPLRNLSLTELCPVGAFVTSSINFRASKFLGGDGLLLSEVLGLLRVPLQLECERGGFFLCLSGGVLNLFLLKSLLLLFDSKGFLFLLFGLSGFIIKLLLSSGSFISNYLLLIGFGLSNSSLLVGLLLEFSGFGFSLGFFLFDGFLFSDAFQSVCFRLILVIFDLLESFGFLDGFLLGVLLGLFDGILLSLLGLEINGGVLVADLDSDSGTFRALEDGLSATINEIGILFSCSIAVASDALTIFSNITKHLSAVI